MKNRTNKWITLYGKLSGLAFRVFIGLVLLTSCEKEKQNQDTYLVDSHKVRAYSSTQSKALLSTLAAEYPEITPLVDNTLYNADVYILTYKTHFKGDEIIASGVVCIPDVLAQFPVLSFQNGTNTLHANAPSVNLLSPLYSVLESMAGNGYILVIADYLGFGASDQILHPYYHRESTNASVIDLLNATDEFISSQTKASENGQLFLMGYSQGGWSTLSVLDELEHDPIQPYNIVAASCGAGAYDVLEVAKYITQLDTYPAPLYLPYFIESHIRNALLDEQLTNCFREPYTTLIPGLFNGLYGNSEVNSQLTTNMDLLLTDDLRNDLAEGPAFGSLRTDLVENSVVAWNSAVKITFTYGTSDDNVPPFESQHMYSNFIDLGVSPEQITLVALDTLNHDTALLPWGIQTIMWFNGLKE